MGLARAERYIFLIIAAGADCLALAAGGRALVGSPMWPAYAFIGALLAWGAVLGWSIMKMSLDRRRVLWFFACAPLLSAGLPVLAASVLLLTRAEDRRRPKPEPKPAIQEASAAPQPSEAKFIKEIRDLRRAPFEEKLSRAEASLRRADETAVHLNRFS